MSELIIQEHTSSSYAPRTYHNASVSDVTIAIAVDYTTAGERLTHKAAGDEYLKLQPECEPIDLARLLYKHMKTHNCKVINVAGNGIYTLVKHGLHQEEVNLFVYRILEPVHKHLGIERIVSGGQTGVDIAGAVAAYKLGIPCTMTYPKGFKMRWADGVDVNMTEKSIRRWVEYWAGLL